MIIDLFGSHSRYARRNSSNALKAELEAAGVTGQAKVPNSIPNLSALLSEPVVKRAVEKKVKAETGGDIGRNIMDLLPVSMTRITKIECRGESCTVRKRCA